MAVGVEPTLPFYIERHSPKSYAMLFTLLIQVLQSPENVPDKSYHAEFIVSGVLCRSKAKGEKHNCAILKNSHVNLVYKHAQSTKRLC